MVAFRARLTEDELAALARLKESEPDICARWNDAFLMRFIWARKSDVERAIELLKNHLAWREEYDIDGEWNMEHTSAYLRHPSYPWTPGNYTKQGYSVSYVAARHIDKELLEELGVAGVMKGNYAALDATLDHDIDVARKGGVFVEDFAGASFFDLMAIVRGESAWDMKKMSEALQNKLPFRVGGFILVNAPWYLRLLLGIVKPMLKPKLRKKIHVCSSIEDLQHYFTPEQLPTIYGGQFEISVDWVDEVFTKRSGLSEGKYLDPSPRSDALVAQITGEQPVLSVSELAAEAKSKKKKDKSHK